MNSALTDSLEAIRTSLHFFGPELLLCCGLIALVVAGLIMKDKTTTLHAFTGVIFASCAALLAIRISSDASPQVLFSGLIKSDSFSDFFKMLFDIAGLLTVFMTRKNPLQQKRLSEYYAIVISIILGAHLLVMSENLLFVFLSLEVISISSYILTGFPFSKASSEGSLKYFVFGAVASSVMLYGFSLLYGITGTLSYTSIEFVSSLSQTISPLLIIAAFFSLSGFLFKIAAAPMHPWAPDVYESTSMPVVALFSVVPKLAGIGILAKFLLALQISTSAQVDWQFVFAIITALTLTIGNFSALGQQNVKRLMAYSSIAQSGFLLIGLVSLSDEGRHFLQFYAAVYVLMNYLIFIFLQYFEKFGFTTIADFGGVSKSFFWPSVFLLIGFIGLTGLPPTAGFTGKLFLFTSLWDAYALNHKNSLMILLVFGLLNTVVSLFYYLRIPYYSFIKTSNSLFPRNNLTSLNYLGLILVLLILLFFFSPGLLMGWINKINFAF